MQDAEAVLNVVKMTCSAWRRQGVDVAQDGQHYTLAQVLRYC